MEEGEKGMEELRGGGGGGEGVEELRGRRRFIIHSWHHVPGRSLWSINCNDYS